MSIYATTTGPAGKFTMTSEEFDAIREDLTSRSEEIARRWYNGVLKERMAFEITPKVDISTLEDIVRQAVDLFTSGLFEPSKARDLGRKVSEMNIGGDDLIGRTQEILTYEFTRGLEPETLQNVHHIITSLMANFTSGYIGSTMDRIESDHRQNSENLMKDLLIVDEKLKKTNEELEALVESRTAELRNLNEKLKKEIEIRRKAENDLKKRENLLSTIFESSVTWTGLLDKQGKLILPNKRSLEFMDLRMDDVVGKLFWETPWWEHSKELQEKVKDAIIQGKKGVSSSFDVYHFSPDGKRHDVQFSIRPVKNGFGEVIYLISEGYDITERIQARKDVEQARDELKDLLENTNDIYFSINGEGILTYIGPQVRQFGSEPEDLVGKSILNLMSSLHPEGVKEAKDAFTKRITEMDDTPRNYCFIDPDGGTHWVEESIKIITDDDGRPVSINGILRDITSRKKAEEELRNLNDVLRLINKIMRHDIQNRLSVAYGLIGLIIERKEFDPKLMKKINTEIKRAVELTKRMADLENLVHSKGTMKKFELDQLISDISDEFNMEYEVIGNSTILADDAIFSIFNNLISNAIMHGHATRMDFNITSNDGICTIRVSNNGREIPEKIHDKIFQESFSYGGRKGSGLGLYITRKLIERYGGEIQLLSSSEGQTTFEIRLPILIV